jgi:hypothetical protein
VAVQVRWDKDGTKTAGEYAFFYGKENGNYELSTAFFMHQRITSAVMRGLVVIGCRT